MIIFFYYSLTDISKPPTFDRKQKPEYTRAGSLLAGSLRTVIIPQNTMEVFLKYAQYNTGKNIETCGILAGGLAQNQLFITHVIIPKQQGTADSCTTSNEEEIFDIQDQNNLITLGWIHVRYSYSTNYYQIEKLSSNFFKNIILQNNNMQIKSARFQDFFSSY